jgi:hypothetical protein
LSWAAGAQFDAQGLAYQRLVAEGGPLLIECLQEQAGRINAAQKASMKPVQKRPG